jgi:hypothetical protein
VRHGSAPVDTAPTALMPSHSVHNSSGGRLPDQPLTVGEVPAELMGSSTWPGAQDWVRPAAGIAPTIVGGSGQDPTTRRLRSRPIPASRQTRLGVSLPGKGVLAAMLPGGCDEIMGVTRNQPR